MAATPQKDLVHVDSIEVDGKPWVAKDRRALHCDARQAFNLRSQRSIIHEADTS